MDRAKLQEALQFAKENGLSSITIDGIRMDIADQIKAEAIELPTESDLNKVFNNQNDGPTDEEVLFWSTPYWDELQAIKKKQLETLAEDKDVRNG